MQYVLEDPGCPDQVSHSRIVSFMVYAYVPRNCFAYGKGSLENVTMAILKSTPV